MKKLINKSFFIMIFISMIGGMLDAFTFIYNQKTFCLIQTGNIIKCFVNLIDGSIQEGLYCLMLFGVFIIGSFIFHFINVKLLSKLRLKDNLINALLLGLLLMPLIFLKFDTTSVFNVSNIVNGIFLSLVGALMLTSFKEENRILYTPTMMTNNTRKMVEHIEDGIINKNKEKLCFGFIYFLIIIAFCVGICIVSLIDKYVDEAINDRIILLILYIFIIILIILNLNTGKDVKEDE